MQYQTLTILLPCQGLEDFPMHHQGDDAASMLANWTALWHPALLHNANAMPTWTTIDNPPNDVNGALLLVPLPNVEDIQTGFPKRVLNDGGRLISGEIDRNRIATLALEGVESVGQPISDDLVADFYALGYCFLQIQTLTRHMRYASNLDEVYFSKELLAAANAAAQGNEVEARELLASCFEVLAEERVHFYPTEVYLIDVTLVAETTLGTSLQQQIAQPHNQNMLFNAADLKKLSQKSPETLATLKRAIAEERIELIGGNDREIPVAQMSCETWRRQFEKGREVYQELTDTSPTVFARRTFGLSPTLPQMLEQFGFQGAVHSAFDGSVVPQALQTHIQWVGSDDSKIDAIATFPAEIDKPETFLNLGIRIGEVMDMHHCAIMWFAHWPSKQSVWLEDLLRVHKYGKALGEFVRLTNFFSEVESPMYEEPFTDDQYPSPILRELSKSDTANPVSRNVRFWNRETKLQSIAALNFVAATVTKQADCAQEKRVGKLVELKDQINEAVDQPAMHPITSANAIDDLLEKSHCESLQALADVIPRTEDKESNGYFVFNPNSFVRRINVDVSELTSLPDLKKPVYATGLTEQRKIQQKIAIVDVPPMGFAWLTNGSESVDASDPLLTDENVLRNEFMEVIIDQQSGGVRAIHDYNARANRLSAKLALRHPTQETRDRKNKKWVYSDLLADSIETTVESSVLGEIVCKGRFIRPNTVAQESVIQSNTENDATQNVDHHSWGSYTATYRLWRGSRVLEIEFEIDPDAELTNDPWNSYFGLRCAWNDESANLFRSFQQMRQPAMESKIEAPHYFDIVTEKQKTTILTGGLTYLHKRDLRMVDMPLITKNERARNFKIGIGVDLTHPMQAANAMLTPPAIQFAKGEPKLDHCWFFHFNAKNVIATWWETISENGKQIGFRVRALETTGRNGEVTLSAFRSIASARRVDFLGNNMADCTIDQGKATFQFKPHEFFELELYW